MPPPANTKEFLQLLDRSGLAEPSQIRESINRIRESGAKPSTPKELAQLLIDQELITQFHAEQLLSGRHRGFMVGKYKILELIGSGGMGRVYLAEHIIMRRRVAVKILPRAKSADPSALGRFQREARAVAALKHPNIVQAYDIDEDRDLHYMVMEYVDGMSVQEYVKRFGPIPWGQAADYICQAADGLHHANQAGLIHRDIKPGNLLIDTTGTIKLLDMGLAVFFEENDRESLTLAYDENVLGTADYLSPEQALDSHNVDIRADIYSLGGTLYYMLSGSPPFPEGTIAQKLLWHQSKDPKPIEELVPGLPDGFANVVRKMMAKKRDQRYSTPGEVRDALTSYAERIEDPFQGKALRLRDSKPGSSKRKHSSPSSLNVQPAVAVPEEDCNPFQPTPPSPTPQGSAPENGNAGKQPPASPPPKKKKPIATPVGAQKPQDQAVELPFSFEPIENESNSPFGDPFSGESAEPQVQKQTQTAQASDDSGDFLRSLGDSSPRVSSQSSSTPTPESGANSDTATGQASSKVLQASDPGRNKLIAAVAAGVAAVLVLGGGAFWFFSGPKVSEPPTKVEKVEPKPAGPDLSDALVVRRSKGAAEPGTYVTVDDALIEADPGARIYIDGVGPWNQTPVEIGPRSLLFPNKDGITFEGSTPETVIQRSGDFDQPLMTIDGSRDITLKNLILDGGGGVGPVLEIRGAGVHGFTAEQVRIRNFRGIGVRIISADGQPDKPIRFTGLTIDMGDPEGHAVVIAPPLEGGSGTNSLNVHFTEANITGPFSSAFHILQTTRGLQIEQSKIRGGDVGIRIAAAHTGWKITGNTFLDLVTAFASSSEADKALSDLGSVENNEFEKVLQKFTSPGVPAPPAESAPAENTENAAAKPGT